MSSKALDRSQIDIRLICTRTRTINLYTAYHHLMEVGGSHQLLRVSKILVILIEL